MKKEINWREIQGYYNLNTLEDTLKKFQISKSCFYKGVNLGFLTKRSRSDSVKLGISKLPKRKHSEETKRKISEYRKKFIMENPDKVPYRLNHSSKESYPEKYFSELFDKEKINIYRYYGVGPYEIDFCIPDKKIAIEIDGNQHYYDLKIIESDKRKTDYLNKDDWDVIRIKWSDYNSLNYENKKDYINELKGYINGLIDKKPIFDIPKKIRKGYNICECGNEKFKYAQKCINCSESRRRKVERPDYNVLLNEINQLGYKGTGIKYGVSDNCIRKWLKVYKKYN